MRLLLGQGDDGTVVRKLHVEDGLDVAFGALRCVEGAWDWVQVDLDLELDSLYVHDSVFL